MPVNVLTLGIHAIIREIRKEHPHRNNVSGRSNDAQCILDAISWRGWRKENRYIGGMSPSWLHIDLIDHGNVDLKASIEPGSTQRQVRTTTPKTGQTSCIPRLETYAHRLVAWKQERRVRDLQQSQSNGQSGVPGGRLVRH